MKNNPEIQEKTEVQNTDAELGKTETTIEELSFSLFEKRMYDAQVAIFNELRGLREDLRKKNG